MRLEDKGFRIGGPGWAEALIRFGDGVRDGYFSSFTRVSPADLRRIEAETGRLLPADFRQFLFEFGHGEFSVTGAQIYDPDEIIAATPGPMWMIKGSFDWASDDDQREFYRTRGRFNPNPEKFSGHSVLHDGYNLLDVLQIGIDGSSGYIELFVGDGPGPFGCCVLYGADGEMEHSASDFSSFLQQLMLREAEG